MAWLYKQPESKLWWIGYRANGKQVRRSLGTKNRKEAEKELAKVQVMFQAQKLGRLHEELYQSLTGTGSGSISINNLVGIQKRLNIFSDSLVR